LRNWFVGEVIRAAQDRVDAREIEHAVGEVLDGHEIGVVRGTGKAERGLSE